MRERLAELTGGGYELSVEPSLSDTERASLMRRLEDGAIDGFLWIDSAAAASFTFTYTTRNVADIMLQTRLARSAGYAVTTETLEKRGITADEAKRILKAPKIKVTKIGAVSNFDVLRGLIVVIAMVAIILLSLLSYGSMVMRSVIEEKASRITEVLLCAATPQELMAGKIIGAGGAGLTQIGTWMVIGAIVVSQSSYVEAAAQVLGIGPAVFVYFLVFYVLGYLLYSAIFAAVGTTFSSTDDAQQWDFVIILPLIFAALLIPPVATSPNSALSVAASLFPFCSPVLMFERLTIESPPFWQVASSVIFLLVSILAMFLLSARIYRVGILMYGKRPSPREMWRWIRQS